MHVRSNRDLEKTTPNIEETTALETIDPFGMKSAEQTVNEIDADRTIELSAAAMQTRVPGGDPLETANEGFNDQTIDLSELDATQG